MTSMLYTARMMNSKPNIPGEIFLGDKEYSWRADGRVNGWLFVATIISGICDIMFPHAIGQMSPGVRVGIVVVEFLALLLWVRSLAKWIRGMDELHRRITTSAVLFAVGATFFILMLWHRLDVAGLFNAVFGTPKTGAGWDICTICHAFLLLTLFYFSGFTVFNRRYR
jgi:hypothetical protein